MSRSRVSSWNFEGRYAVGRKVSIQMSKLEYQRTHPDEIKNNDLSFRRPTRRMSPQTWQIEEKCHCEEET